jgi:beta-D-xylosidase 4
MYNSHSDMHNFSIEGKSIDVEFSYGCRISGNDETGFASAIELARVADVVFFFGGLDQSIEAEGRDRISIALPPIQLSLLQQIEKVVRAPIHVVIMSGSSLDLSYIRDSANYSSLIWMGYAGQSGGLAVATVVFGQYNPGGRLPITFYPASYVDAVSMFDMRMRPSATNPGRTYKFYTGQAAYEFAAGLSYTTFNYSWSNDTAISSYSIRSLMKDNYDKQPVLVCSFRVNVTNVGPIAGDDVVLGFVSPPQQTQNDETPPIKQLFGFQRVHLNVNETTQVFFPFNTDALLTVAHDGSKWLHPGHYRIMVGQQLMHTIELRDKSTLWSETINQTNQESKH